jgi:hypothetical protein
VTSDDAGGSRDWERVPERVLRDLEASGSGQQSARSVAYWRAAYERERERLVKLWLVLQDAEAEVDELRSRVAFFEANAAIDDAEADGSNLESQVLVPTHELQRLRQERAAHEVRRELFRGTEGGRMALAPTFDRWDALAEGEEPSDAFHYGPYALYALEGATTEGGSGVFYFFARHSPKRGRPVPMPEGCVVRVNPRNGLPYLVRTG